MKTTIRYYFLLLLGVWGIFSTLLAQAPHGYYTAAEGKSGTALKAALHTIIREQRVLTYNGVREALKTTDEDPNNRRNVLLLYTNWSYPKNNFGGGVAQWNREHTWAKSKGNFGTSKGPGTDLHHLRPTDVSVNSKRGSLMFDNGGTLYIDKSRYGGGSGETGCRVGSNNWEPADRVKGDVARMLFYMAVRYEKSGVNNDFVDLELAESSSNSGKHGRLSALKVWHRNDPVSDWEIRRNNRIYDFQNNRNPFIDHPELAEYLWGDKVGQAWHSNQTAPTIIQPKGGTPIEIGKVAYQQSNHKTILVKAERLTGNLRLQLSGENASEFSLSTSVMTAQDAQKGQNLVITCRPTSLGQKRATLTISGGGATSVSVHITAESTSTFLATPATEVTGHSFTANWTNANHTQGYILDVYTKSNETGTSQELLHESFDNGLPSGWQTDGYIESLKTGGIRLASSKKNGKITTTSIDLSQPTTLHITTQQYNRDNGAILSIYIDNTILTTIKTTNEQKKYTVEIPAHTKTSKLSLEANKKSRVYLYDIRITTQGSTPTKTSITGFPKNIGNNTSYKVTQLTELTTYYYTVTPYGGQQNTSNEISVTTHKSTSNDIEKEEKTPPYSWYRHHNLLTITNNTQQMNIQVFDLLGKNIFNTITEQKETKISLPQRGVYLLILQGEKHKPYSTTLLY